MGWIQTVAPTLEPISVSEAKLHLRGIPYGDEDSLIANYIAAARAYVESECDIQIMRATWQWTLDRFPPGDTIQFPKPPLAGVSSITYTDTDGVEQTLDPSKYVVDTTSLFGRISLAEGESWPSTLSQANTVIITFLAGYADRSSIPPNMRGLLLLIIGHFYENREAASPERIYEVPLAARSLMSQLRRFTFR
jgi:uncharacterized phiE125 gp8 family phage protein